MKDVYEILRLKELEISRLEIEVEALRVIAPLLSDDNEASDDNTAAAAGSIAPLLSIRLPQETNDSPQAGAHLSGKTGPKAGRSRAATS